MAIFDGVRSVVQRLAPRGWAALLAQHGLDLNATNLEAELRRNLPAIDRTKPGFTDFSPSGKAGIAPGSPALSLLYHALASSDVFPLTSGPRTAEDFPTLAELDAVENYIYASAKRKLTDFNPSTHAIAIFAYQYRAGHRSPHRAHADMAFSRAGVARVGTEAANYDPLRRSFWIAPPNGGAGVAVMPARYGVFIARRGRPSTADAVMHRQTGDGSATFLFPVHKLFAGNECLTGRNIARLALAEFHRNEKLRKAHQFSALSLAAGFNVNAAPFVRESGFVTLQPVGASTLVSPVARPRLARPATQRNSVSGIEEEIRFQVPPSTATNRFFTSFQIPAAGNGRRAPEYVHIRRELRPGQPPFDINTLPDPAFATKVDAGNYSAAHFVDDSAEGVLAVDCDLPNTYARFAAYSMVSAPDFLPLVDQLEIERWIETRGLDAGGYFAQGRPDPLCDGRGRGVNPVLRDPVRNVAPALTSGGANSTIMAVVGAAPKGTTAELGAARSLSTSWLTDAASNIFAPGWDTSIDQDAAGREFYAAYGLGSPFPEDAKLCAALNSFWPAAAPDVGRTFGGFSALPHLDDELGFHPRHPAVLAGQASAGRGWDGEFGPFFATPTQINFASLDRSDYTVAAMEGRIQPGPLQRIDAIEQIARMEGYRDCVLSAHGILGSAAAVSATPLRLITAEKVADWSTRPDRLNNAVTGAGYLYVFVTPTGPRTADPLDNTRVQQNAGSIFVCQFDASTLVIRRNQTPARVVARPLP